MINNIKKFLNFHGIKHDNEVWKITKKNKEKTILQEFGAQNYFNSRLGYVCVDEKCSLLKK
jgi:hypothetical protein